MGRWQSGQLHQTVNLTPHGYVGSNPTLPKLNSTCLSIQKDATKINSEIQAPVVQWIEQQPSKLWIQVRSLAGVNKTCRLKNKK